MRCTLAWVDGPIYHVSGSILHLFFLLDFFGCCKFYVCGCGSSGSGLVLGSEASWVQKQLSGLFRNQVLLIKVKVISEDIFSRRISTIR